MLNKAIVLATKAHARCFEYRMIEEAKASNRYIIDNKTDATKSILPEISISDMETYIDNIKIVLPTLGLDIFNSSQDEKKHNKNTIYHLKTPSFNAKGISSNKGFLVFKDSEMRLEHVPSLHKGLVMLKEHLISKEFVYLENKKYKFSIDYEFTSLSAASSIIKGASTNGRNEWIDKNGISLKEHEESLEKNILS